MTAEALSIGIVQCALGGSREENADRVLDLVREAARRLGEEGRVVLRVRVSAEGMPVLVEVKQSSGFPRLDEAARTAVEHWRFVPARQGSEAIESSVLVQLQFALDG